MICGKPLDLIGGTPVLRLEGNDKGAIFLKLEDHNPTGSVKDRPAREMIEDLLERKLIDKTSRLVEASLGNTALSLSFVAACLGLRLTVVAPDNADPEILAMCRAYGAEVVLTPAKRGFAGAIAHARALEKKEGYFFLDQLHSRANQIAHMRTTAVEIIDDFPDGLDYLVAGVGTAGTIMGLARVLKLKMPDIRIVAVEPRESPVLSGGKKGRHHIRGIGLGQVPPLFEREAVDMIVDVPSREALAVADELARKGLLLGPSSAAALIAARRILGEHPEARILAIAPDGRRGHAEPPADKRAGQ